MKTESPRKKLGIAIRACRESKGLSQEAFAFECRLHRTYVSSVERGERNVSLENILRMSQALGLKAHQLLERSDL